MSPRKTTFWLTQFTWRPFSKIHLLPCPLRVMLRSKRLASHASPELQGCFTARPTLHRTAALCTGFQGLAMEASPFPVYCVVGHAGQVNFPVFRVH